MQDATPSFAKNTTTTTKVNECDCPETQQKEM
jgi:hypothetical protein